MTNHLEKYLEQFERYKRLIHALGEAIGDDHAVSCLTAEQQDTLILPDLLKALRKGFVENRTRSLKNAKPRVEIKPLPFREKQYGRVYLVARTDGVYVLTNGGENWFRYGDAYEFFRAARRTEKETSWESGGFSVHLTPEGRGFVKIDDRFVLDQALVLPFLEERLLKLGSLSVLSLKGGTLEIDAIYRGVPLPQKLRDARLRYSSQTARERTRSSSVRRSPTRLSTSSRSSSLHDVARKGPGHPSGAFFVSDSSV